MGKIWMPGGGGGADLDVVTAGRPDVLTGKVIVDKDGEPLTGTMPDNGAVSQSLGINGTYTIPEGYHNGLGKVIQNVATMAGLTVTPGISQQTVNSSGKYMTGNVVVAGDSNLASANILRGKNIFNVAGSNNVLKYLSGNAISGTSALSLGNGTSWYYITVNPGFTPVFALAICGSLLWRTGTSANYESVVSGASGYYGSVPTSIWLWTSASVRLPCASGNETCYYYIFGY